MNLSFLGKYSGNLSTMTDVVVHELSLSHDFILKGDAHVHLLELIYQLLDRVRNDPPAEGWADGWSVPEGSFRLKLQAQLVRDVEIDDKST